MLVAGHVMTADEMGRLIDDVTECKNCGGTGRVEHRGADGSYLAYPCPVCRVATLPDKEA